ncbi:MAG: cytochrome c nitrite reductase small subunit [Ignavibacteria bacterium]|nr:cytochrome c nitrite reductase small subunit [Ignavibacteria bacterium]
MKYVDKIISYTKPPNAWKVSVIIISGVMTGLILWVLYVGNAVSYLSDKPETCINCHVMNPQFATWRVSSHANVATCNDCHVPQDNIFRKYMFKASDGLRHSTMFTFRLEPQTIRIKSMGADVVQENCKRCHEHLIDHSSLMKTENDEERKCWSCHMETPHGSVRSLSSTPNVNVEKPFELLPEWMQKYNIKNSK